MIKFLQTVDEPSLKTWLIGALCAVFISTGIIWGFDILIRVVSLMFLVFGALAIVLIVAEFVRRADRELENREKKEDETAKRGKL